LPISFRPTKRRPCWPRTKAKSLSAGISANGDDESEAQRLFAFVRGQHGRRLVGRKGGCFIRGSCACLCCGRDGVPPEGQRPRGSLKKSAPVGLLHDEGSSRMLRRHYRAGLPHSRSRNRRGWTISLEI